MRAFVFNIVCLACAGHAPKHQTAVAPEANEALAALLFSLSPAAGFQAPSALSNRLAAAAPRATADMLIQRNFKVRKPSEEVPSDMVVANGGRSMEDFARWEPGYDNPTPWYTEGDMPDYLFDYDDFEDAFNEALPFWKPEEDLEDALVKCKGPEDVEQAIADCLAAGGRDIAPVMKTANKLKKDMEKAAKDGKPMPKAKPKKKVKASPPNYERVIATTHDTSRV
mmetsp:Transcript_123344/g.230605  ORF Transcript_123344/g.230605 Transcript_123344/m.230605 type:complete len:225 (+) Transcript_123344:53-727(+)